MGASGSQSPSGADQLLRTASQLGASVDALAALAAHLRVETESLDVDPAVREHLAQVAAAVLGESGAIPPDTRAAAVGMAEAFLRQAIDLIENPDRPGGWGDPDEALLQGIGRLSGSIVGAVQSAESHLEGLADLLRTPGSTFLDVGTGTGWLAIAVARAYPDLAVTGIDIFEPSLALARDNVDGADLDARVELVQIDAADLDATEAFDLIWLPLPFLRRDIVPAVVERCHRALRPGGWLLPGIFAGPDDPVSERLLALKTVRSGGHPWSSDELLGVLDQQGLSDVCEVPRRWAAPVRLFAGRRDATANRPGG